MEWLNVVKKEECREERAKKGKPGWSLSSAKAHRITLTNV